MTSICLPAGDVYVPVKIEEEDLFGGILKVLAELKPDWAPENIKFKTFTDGITNKLVGCQLNGTELNSENVVLVRIYGNKTDLLIDRKAELRNIKTLNKVGLAPKVYGVFENGLAYQYYPGVTLNVETVIIPKIWPLVACQMAKMHKVNLGSEVPKEPVVWEKIEQFLNLLPEPFTDQNKQSRFVNSFGSVTKLRIEYERLKSHLSKSGSSIVFAHNDLLLGNVVYNQDEETISFIDYEYAMYNYQAFDIANHFNEFVGLSIEDIDYKKYPEESFQKSWIRVYLEEYMNNAEVSDTEVEELLAQVSHMSLASHFMWGVWSLVQYQLSDIEYDFGRYAEIRLFRYYEIKDSVYKQLS